MPAKFKHLIEETKAEAFRAMPDSELRDFRFRFIQLFDRFFHDPATDQIRSMAKGDFLSRYVELRVEMTRRGLPLSTEQEIDRLVKDRVVRKGLWSLDVPGLGDITLAADYVAIVGSYIQDPREPGAIQVVVKANTADRGVLFDADALAVSITKALEETGKEIRIAWAKGGCPEAHMPVFDLVLRPKATNRITQAAPEALEEDPAGGLYAESGAAAGGGQARLEKRLTPAQQTELDAESAAIRESAKTARARGVHKFEPAKWTHPNGHPRCLICGEEEPIGGICHKPAPSGPAEQPVELGKGGPGSGNFGHGGGQGGPGNPGGSSGGGLSERTDDELKTEVLSHIHTLEDVATGQQPVGVEGRGGKDMKEAAELGLYTAKVEGVPIYARTQEEAKPLEDYLKAGGEYGTPEFSRILGYSPSEIAVYREWMSRQPKVEKGGPGSGNFGHEGGDGGEGNPGGSQGTGGGEPRAVDENWYKATTPAELDAVDAWTSSEYENMRASMASGKGNKSPETQKQIDDLNAMFDRYPNGGAHDKEVFRGLHDVPDSVFQALGDKNPGDDIEIDKAIQSWSGSRETAEGFSHGGNSVIFKLPAGRQSTKELDISKISSTYTDEKEIIMQTTGFKIAGIEVHAYNITPRGDVKGTRMIITLGERGPEPVGKGGAGSGNFGHPGGEGGEGTPGGSQATGGGQARAVDDKWVEQVTPQEKKAVDQWTGTGYVIIRNHLAGEPAETEWGKEAAQNLEAMFDKYPNGGAQDRDLHRGLSEIPDDVFAALASKQPGDSLTIDKAPQSWSKYSTIAEDFAREGKTVMFSISRGRQTTRELDIDKIGLNNEKEVIMANTRFKVASIEKKVYNDFRGKRLVVTLEEEK